MTEHFHSMLNMMTNQEVDIFEWSETTVEWNNYNLNGTLFPIFKKHSPGGKWNPTTSQIPTTSNYKPGGNLMGLAENINMRTHLLGRDQMGR